MEQGIVRIIGGQWRGRKLRFPAIPGLRPTPDRIRETLFNWLAPDIVNAYCLDLFAGSGALGIEALSRGAQHVTFIDQAPAIIRYLHQQLAILGTDKASVYHTQIPCAENIPIISPFNIVFLDPPFNQNLIQPCCQWLEAQHCLAENAYVYLETEAALNPLPIPQHWELLHSKKAGQVGYHLAQSLLLEQRP